MSSESIILEARYHSLWYRDTFIVLPVTRLRNINTVWHYGISILQLKTHNTAHLETSQAMTKLQLTGNFPILAKKQTVHKTMNTAIYVRNHNNLIS